MSYNQQLAQALQHEYFGGEPRNTLLNVKTQRFVKDCQDSDLESIILDMIDQLSARNIKVKECFVTSHEIIFTLE